MFKWQTPIYIILTIIFLIGVLLLVNASDYVGDTSRNMYIVGGTLVGFTSLIIIIVAVDQSRKNKVQIERFYDETVGKLSNKQKAIVASTNSEIRRENILKSSLFTKDGRINLDE